MTKEWCKWAPHEGAMDLTASPMNTSQVLLMPEMQSNEFLAPSPALSLPGGHLGYLP